MRPRPLCRSVRQRGLTGPFSSAGAPVWAFLVRGVSRITPGHGSPFPGLSAGAVRAAKTLPPPAARHTAAEHPCYTAHAESRAFPGCFFAGTACLSAFFLLREPLAPGQRKSPPSDLFMALRLRRLPCAAVFSLPKRSAERADGAFFPAGAPVWAFPVRGVFPLWKGLSIVFSGVRSASMGLFPLGKGHAFCPGFPVCAAASPVCLHSPFPRLFPMFFVCAGQGGAAFHGLRCAGGLFSPAGNGMRMFERVFFPAGADVRTFSG